jgi:hypothetical protein
VFIRLRWCDDSHTRCSAELGLDLAGKTKSETIMTGRAMGLTRSRGDVALIAASTSVTRVATWL